MTAQSNLQCLYVAMQHIAKRRNLAGAPTTHRGKLGFVEGIAHELAHRLEAGRGFELRLRRASDKTANAHEASTLRIEVAALAALGARVSLQRLWHDANWQGESEALTKARHALSPRERKRVAAFIRIVRCAMKARNAIAAESVEAVT